MGADLLAAPRSAVHRRALWLEPRGALVLTAIYMAWAWALLTNLDFHPVAQEKLGQVFPDMARRLLAWDFSADPAAIQFEAFNRAGVTYAYYGIFPALLRMPFLPVLPAGVDVARLSCVAALGITVFGYIRVFQIAVWDRPARLTGLAAIAAVMLSGPQIFVLASASIYHELIFWSAALTALFHLVLVRRWAFGLAMRGQDYLGLAVLAGLCLLCRVPNGAGLYLALLLLLVHGAATHFRTMPGGGLRGAVARPGPLLMLLGAGCLSLSFVGVQATVNYHRWGNALEASPYAYYTQFARDPDAVARFARHGLFAWTRVAMAIGYYGAGLKLEQAAPALFEEYYGGIEGPRAVIPALAPLLFVLAAAGVWQMLRRPVQHLVPGIAALGGVVPLLLMLGFLALCLRYAFDGWGVLVLLAAVGLRGAAGWRPALVGAAALLLLTAGIAGSHLMLLRYKIVYSGTDPVIRYNLSQRLQPLLCPNARLDPTVKLTDFNPLVTPNCPPLW